ncbi:MAG: ribosome maturation factor RimP [Desulfobacteraceae bacterium]|nr:ribosome maturation factor RimP [Desulfobacteraceae bacterium]
MGFGRQDDTGTLKGKIREVALPLCQAENIELVHIEYNSGEKEKMVRIYIDKPGGITMDDCAYVSRQLGDLIDIHIERIGSYRLEVSSPGPNRPLNTKENFYRFTGERIKIETYEIVEGQKKFTGILEKINDDSVIIAVDGKKVEIEDLMISKAMLAGQ